MPERIDLGDLADAVGGLLLLACVLFVLLLPVLAFLAIWLLLKTLGWIL